MNKTQRVLYSLHLVVWCCMYFLNHLHSSLTIRPTYRQGPPLTLKYFVFMKLKIFFSKNLYQSIGTFMLKQSSLENYLWKWSRKNLFANICQISDEKKNQINFKALHFAQPYSRNIQLYFHPHTSIMIKCQKSVPEYDHRPPLLSPYYKRHLLFIFMTVPISLKSKSSLWMRIENKTY